MAPPRRGRPDLRQPAHRPVRPHGAAGGRAPAGRGLPGGAGPLRRAREEPGAHPHLPDHAPVAVERTGGGHVGLVVSRVARSRPEPRGVVGLVREYRYHASQEPVVGAHADSAGHQCDCIPLSRSGEGEPGGLTRRSCTHRPSRSRVSSACAACAESVSLAARTTLQCVVANQPLLAGRVSGDVESKPESFKDIRSRKASRLATSPPGLR